MPQNDGCSETAIKAFLYNFEKLTSGANLMIPESALSPVESLPSYDALTDEKPELLKDTVMLKLNGGLGTGMGLEKAKSLLPLKGDDTFLDFIAKQVEHMRTSTGVDLAFMLMNSFATSADTLAHLDKYPLATQGLPLEFQQNKAPKVTADGYAPATWATNPACEWCPPGHGDLYPAMVGSGTLDALIAKGFKRGPHASNAAPWQRPSSIAASPQAAPGGPGQCITPGEEEAGPLGAQPLPWVLEPAVSNVADSTAFGPPGTCSSLTRTTWVRRWT